MYIYKINNWRTVKTLVDCVCVIISSAIKKVCRVVTLTQYPTLYRCSDSLSLPLTFILCMYAKTQILYKLKFVVLFVWIYFLNPLYLTSFNTQKNVSIQSGLFYFYSWMKWHELNLQYKIGLANSFKTPSYNFDRNILYSFYYEV